MNPYIKLILRLFLLIVLVIGMNFIYKKYFFETDIQTYSEVINKVRKVVADSCEIIYLGESSNNTFRSDDVDKRAISDFINDYFPDKKVGNITKEASHAGNYYVLLKNIPESSKVKTVIVTLNLRSFDANWIYSNLETPLQKSMVMLRKYPPLFNRVLLSFKGYDIKTEQEREKQFKQAWKNSELKFPFPVKYTTVTEWDKAMFRDGIKNSDGTKNNELTSLACHYIKTYAFQIDVRKNLRIKDFDKIVKLARQRNWNLIFNLMAENTQKARNMVGDELVFLIKENRDLLVNRYIQDNVVVVDNLECVDDEQYIDQNWTTEHYAEKGRKIIAKNVAAVLKNYYPDEFKPILNITKTRKEFYNDCEGYIIWGQMQTLSEEAARTGKKSSKTGDGEDFSITFEYPIYKLPDSLVAVNVDFQLYSSEMPINSEVMMEISGKNFKFNLTDTLLARLCKTHKSWEEISFTFGLPDKFYQADLIKIYIYNPDKSVLFIDDLKIKFTNSL